MTEVPDPDPEPDEKDYASTEEVQAALRQLSPADEKKLAMIAAVLCERRIEGTSEGWQGPDDLLQEAIVRTLAGDKRWRRSVSMVKHLDRAMENISGHAAARHEKAPVLSGLEGELDEGETRLRRPRRAGPHPFDSAVDYGAAVKDDLVAARRLFAADQEALRLLESQSEGRTESEIQQLFGIGKTQYDTITKRIRRRLARIVTKTGRR